MKAERVHLRLSWILAAIVLAAQVAGAGAWARYLWGADAYAWLPRGALVAAGLALLALGAAALGRSAALDRALLALPGAGEAPPARRRLVPVALALAFFAACWIFREGHTLLGDGHALSVTLPLGTRFHPNEPLTALAQSGIYHATRPLFEAPGRDPAEVARDSVALGSAIAGLLFALVAWALAGEIARLAGPGQGGPVERGRDRRGGEAEERGRDPLVPLVWLLLLGGGYVQLFFGYVENYTLHTLAVGLYLLLALRFLRGSAPLLLPGLALLLAIGLHFSALALAPSFAVLAGAGLARHAGRSAAARDLAILAAVLVLGGLGLGRLFPGYGPAGTAARLVAGLFAGATSATADYRLLSWVHVLDFVNEQLLIGPVALVLFAVAAAVALRRRVAAEGPGLFALVAGAGSLAACWIAGDSNLGYARNWDLLAPAGLVLLAAGLVLAVRSPWEPRALRRWTFLLALVSLFHTVPWIAVNASFERSFARFQSLPLGWGRTEAVVGTWYLAHGDTTRAVGWLERSLAVNPLNNIASGSLAEVALRRGEYRRAAEAYWMAVRARPDKQLYRLGLVNAIVRGGGPLRIARAQLDTLLAAEPADPGYWAAYGVTCLGLGLRDSAAAAFARGRRLSPSAPIWPALEARLREPDGYARAVGAEWPAIVGP